MAIKALKNVGLATALGTALFAGSVTGPAEAQSAQKCAKHEQIVKLLKNRYKEKRAAVGLVANNGVMELYVSKNGSWTALFIRTDGIACVMAAGSALETLNVSLGPEV